MKLELKHLAPYLPYELNICYSAFMFRDKNNDIETGTMVGISDIVELDVLNETTFDIIMRRDKDFYKLHDSRGHFKPILRPLSDLFKLIDWDNNNEPYMIGYKYGVEKVKEDGVEFYADEYYADYAESPKCYIDVTSFNWWLFEHHFDVFGLIEKGLAIDINTLKK